jgi:hypothetical protein
MITPHMRANGVNRCPADNRLAAAVHTARRTARRFRRYRSDGDRSAPSGQGCLVRAPHRCRGSRPREPSATPTPDVARERGRAGASGPRSIPCLLSPDPLLARPRPRRRGTSHPVAARGGWHQNPSCPKASGPEGRDQSLSRHLAARTLCGPPAGIGRGQPPRRWLKLGDVARRIRPPSARHPPASLRGPRSARARSASGGRGRRS